MEEKKKMAAAISAVTAYLDNQEETGLTSRPADRMRSRPAEETAQAGSLWEISGRQEMMHLRHLMQLKAFHGQRIG